MSKKTCILLTVLLCLLGVFAAAGAEDLISSDEEFMAELNRARSEQIREFEIVLTEDYFEEIRANGFSKFSILALKCGMADQSLRYSYTGTLLFSDVRWVEPHVAECSTDKEVREAIERFMREETGSFQLVCPQELADALQQNNHLYQYIGRCGIEDFELKYTFGNPRVYYFDKLKTFTVPWAVAADENEFRNAVDYMWRQNAAHFYVLLDPGFYEALQNDSERRDLMETSSQMEQWRFGRSSYYCRYEYDQVAYSPEPRLLCLTEEDIQEAVRQMGASGTSSFRLVMTRDLYAAVRENQFARLQELTADAGMSSGDLQYYLTGSVAIYSNAVIHSDVVKLTNADEAMSYTSGCAARGEKEITLFCTDSLYTLLIGGISPFSFVEDVMAPIYDVTAQAGIFEFTFSYSAATHIITLHVESFYPGTRILSAAEHQDFSELTARENETYTAALQVAESCRKDSSLETARAIHDWLCSKNIYTDDELTTEDDTAIGAILNGQANCDGYADAFYLIGRLAGLNVRYQHGDSYPVGHQIRSLFNTVTHMWNLVEIDGTWRLVDVTWDNQEEGTVYTWFNLGEDRARRMHIWNAETSVPLLPVTDLSVRPENEYLIADSADAEEAIRDAVSRDFTFFELIYADGTPENHHELLNLLSSLMNASYQYSWNERMLTLKVYR